MVEGFVKSRPETSIDPSVRIRLTEIAESITHVTDRGELQALLHSAALLLGAERSFFATMSGEGRDTTYAFVLDCDAGWWHRFRAAYPLQKNPWLVYASGHSTPARATQLGSTARERQGAKDLAVAAGFGSALLIPVHSGRSESRASVLCLGHSVAGCFEDPTFAKLQVGARSLAMELHDWWSLHDRQQLTQHTQLSEGEVRLLERHFAGFSSKQIAFELSVSRQSVNSRFQRIVAKMGVRNRRAAARVALECGLFIA